MISRFYTQALVDGSKRRHVKGDPQKQYVYQMEREIVGGSINQHMPLENMQAIASHACRKWGVRKVTVQLKDKTPKEGFGWTTSWNIILNSGYHGDNIGVLLHELAHWITDALYDEVYDHGAEFMSVYADLLAQYKILPRDCLLLLAARYGVEVGERTCSDS